MEVSSSVASHGESAGTGVGAGRGGLGRGRKRTAVGRDHCDATADSSPYGADVPRSLAPRLGGRLAALELDDAARRSVERRRASTLEYPEANEEVGFKGTMAMVGCGVLWVMLSLLILSVWVPLLGRFILPAWACSWCCNCCSSPPAVALAGLETAPMRNLPHVHPLSLSEMSGGIESAGESRR